MTDTELDGWRMLLDTVASLLDQHHAQGWFVGGSLRNALLGLSAPDVDLAVTCEPMLLARALRERLPVTIAALNRDSVRLGVPDTANGTALQLDVSPLHGASINADLAQRDFRVNAMALPLDRRDSFLGLLAGRDRGPLLAEMIDPLGGRADLEHHRLSLASDHAFTAEPGRMLRAARLVAAYAFAPTDDLLVHAKEAGPRLLELSPDRLRDELNALLALPHASAGLDLLANVGALGVLFPELASDEMRRHATVSIAATNSLQAGGQQDVLDEMDPLATLEPLRAWYATALPDGQTRIVALRWGLLLHARAPHTLDVEGAPAAGAGARASGFRRLRLPAAERAIAYEIEAHAAWTRRMLAETEPDEITLRHLFAASGDVGVDVLVAAAACNAALAREPLDLAEPAAEVTLRARAALDLFFADRARLIPPPLLTGADLIRELGMAPGPAIRDALAAIRAAHLDGALATREEALAFARELLGRIAD